MDIDFLARRLASRKPGAVFGIPGSGPSLSLLDALEKLGVPFHLTRFEGSAVLMAAAMGRLSGKAGLSLSIKGPGLANSVPGLAAAWLEAFPVVHLTEATPGTAPPWQAHKRMDHQALVKAVSKGTFPMPAGGDDLDGFFNLAEAEEPGPVVVQLTRDQEVSLPSQPLVMEQSSMDDVLELIQGCRRPAVIAGTLAIRRGWSGMLNKLSIPVFSTAAAKGVVNETLPQAAGVYTGAGAELTPEFQLLPGADLVICLGLTAREVLATGPFARKSISISAIEAPGHAGFSFDHSLGTSAAAQVLEALTQKSWGLDELLGILLDLKSRVTRGFLPGRVFELINSHFNGQVRAVMDTGYFCTIGEHAWTTREPEHCLMSGQGRYMGTGLPMALGAGIFDPSIPTIAFLGDGGIGMYPSEARLAAAEKLPLLIILMSDNAFGSIRTRAIKDGLTQAPLTMDGRSWTGLFESMGIPGTRAENPGQAMDSVSSWDPESGPAFLEIIFDPDKYEAMVRGIR